MGWFKGKNTKSTLRFCESATELDTFHLFDQYDLTLALSWLSEWHHDAREPTKTATAFGVVHDSYDHGQPLLPVEVEFSFSPQSEEGGVGRGEVWKDKVQGMGFYKAQFYICDPERRIFDQFARTFEHAVMSGHSFVHLVLRRERRPYIKDNKEREAARKARSEELEALMKQVDAGHADLPSVEFDYVAFDDLLVLNAPVWSYAWKEGKGLGPAFHDRKAAEWRNRPWRN